MSNTLTKKSTEILVHATITSRLDQNNCLLVGATKEELDKLQCVQKAAARLICKYEYARSTLAALSYRCKFKLLMLVFKSLTGLAPSCLSDLIQPYSKALSAEACLVQADPCNLMSWVGRAFPIIGPNLWRHFFRLAFSL